ncbi:hypothetical protein Cni_G11150 [Canna indica]|uniref:Uncharacterized protein n=1 Tax=Canna indica TaxID=4628 RepID=A0AAQ3QAJ9_9LILI|nr:hypothetical protein Cni_G11150 [Canna indica]
MASAAGADLEDVPSLDLMTELLRRMKCASKPDKRLILIALRFLSLCRSLDFRSVIDYYKKKDLVAQLHAEKPPKEVTAEVQKALS